MENKQAQKQTRPNYYDDRMYYLIDWRKQHVHFMGSKRHAELRRDELVRNLTVKPSDLVIAKETKKITYSSSTGYSIR